MRVITVGQIRARLRLELEQQLISLFGDEDPDSAEIQPAVAKAKEQMRDQLEQALLNLPGDKYVVRYKVVDHDRAGKASLLVDVMDIVPKLRLYNTQRTVVEIMGEGNGLETLLSEWKYRLKVLEQKLIK